MNLIALSQEPNFPFGFWVNTRTLQRDHCPQVQLEAVTQDRLKSEQMYKIKISLHTPLHI